MLDLSTQANSIHSKITILRVPLLLIRCVIVPQSVTTQLLGSGGNVLQLKWSYCVASAPNLVGHQTIGGAPSEAHHEQCYQHHDLHAQLGMLASRHAPWRVPWRPLKAYFL